MSNNLQITIYKDTYHTLSTYLGYNTINKYLQHNDLIDKWFVVENKLQDCSYRGKIKNKATLQQHIRVGLNSMVEDGIITTIQRKEMLNNLEVRKMQRNMYYITVIDNFMSYWGKCDDCNNMLIFATSSKERAKNVLINCKNRSDFSDIHIYINNNNTKDGIPEGYNRNNNRLDGYYYTTKFGAKYYIQNKHCHSDMRKWYLKDMCFGKKSHHKPFNISKIQDFIGGDPNAK